MKQLSLCLTIMGTNFTCCSFNSFTVLTIQSQHSWEVVFTGTTLLKRKLEFTQRKITKQVPLNVQKSGSFCTQAELRGRKQSFSATTCWQISWVQVQTVPINTVDVFVRGFQRRGALNEHFSELSFMEQNSCDIQKNIKKEGGVVSIFESGYCSIPYPPVVKSQCTLAYQRSPAQDT